jgi:tyrosinase
MVAAAAARAGETEQTLLVDLAFPGEDGVIPFTRADLVFTGLRHGGSSYEVRLFLNNLGATADTPRTPEERYAGRFNIFGHGGCYGDEGHCEVPESVEPEDLRPPHPLTPINTFVTITPALRAVLDGGGALATVTLVPIAMTPRKADRKPAPELLKFEDVTLQTYLTATEDDAE